ncbi:Heat shock protein Hsp-16.2 [Thelohanellus kitauei]|uniref:Heat shock protein Hsp-16.2 n=1 Tax=Thelohanellus kitauei TaxID=669202 RepID=A0A0C2NIK2_THEKT|nr:Heat shock protein Hsp-16.2 [Thelohanellus kitauei]
MDFVREYDIPNEVEENSITSRITPNGILIVEGNILKDDVTNCLSKEAVDISDACKFHIYVNIACFKPEDISVKLLGNDLIVEGKCTTEFKSDDGKKKMKKIKSFIYCFTLPSDIDINNMVPKFSAPCRLDIEAPRLNKKNECAEKSLEIKNGQSKA